MDPTTCANCGGLASHDIAVSKESVVNAKAGQGDLLMTVPVSRRINLLLLLFGSITRLAVHAVPYFTL